MRSWFRESAASAELTGRAHRSCAENPPIRALQKDCRVRTRGRQRQRQDQRRAAPRAYGYKAANDIDVDDRSTGILAPLNGGLVLPIEGDEPEPALALPGTNLDRKCVCRDRKRRLHGHPGRSCHDRVDCFAVGSHGLVTPVDDHLWRVDARKAERSGVALLTGRRCGTRERISPAETIPIIDVEAKR